MFGHRSWRAWGARLNTKRPGGRKPPALLSLFRLRCLACPATQAKRLATPASWHVRGKHRTSDTMTHSFVCAWWGAAVIKTITVALGHPPGISPARLELDARD